MRGRILLKRLQTILLSGILWSVLVGLECSGLSFGATPSRRSWMKRVTTAIGGILTTESRIFVQDRTAKAAINIEPNQLKFRAPTEDQPQISLPTRPVEDEPLVQGTS